MKILNRAWFRIIVSLFLGGVATEIIHISTGDPNRPQEINFTILFAGIFYLIITLFTKKYLTD
ncbi:hypothetical protein [Gelidibacter salicanalis]|uniref:Uncharacterized protein n=1 Tax=Gelidibacter salicanalis TaxID=291193 RepID=A0A934KZS9_9FLAO|nr:hypothetical protein [Gelidibacter salicanalis]MBJ7882655.1 hypothetical protein [Gelidibacter salicanalis]